VNDHLVPGIAAVYEAFFLKEGGTER